MDGGAVIAIASSVGPSLIVVVGAVYHLGNKLGQIKQVMKGHDKRLEVLEGDCKKIPAVEAKVDILINSRKRRKKA